MQDRLSLLSAPRGRLLLLARCFPGRRRRRSARRGIHLVTHRSAAALQTAPPDQYSRAPHTPPIERLEWDRPVFLPTLLLLWRRLARSTPGLPPRRCGRMDPRAKE